jgi:microcystin-dependent protein
MADGTTPHYSWTLPEVHASANSWGDKMNSNLGLIDAQVFAASNGISPIGAVIMFAGAAAPANWLICNGASLSPTGTYAALFAAIGYTYTHPTPPGGSNFLLPNLTGLFPAGSNGLNLGNTGGAAAVTLSSAQMPVHAHTFTPTPHNHSLIDPTHAHAIIDPTHAHAASQVAHSHGIPDTVLLGAGAGAGAGIGAAVAANRRTDTQQPAVTVGASGTGISAAAAATGISAAAASAGGSISLSGGSGGVTQPVSIIPPYLSMNFIIRYQ